MAIILAVTGHRPEKLGNKQLELAQVAMEEIRLSSATMLLQGMASGFDLNCARWAWRVGMPFQCVKPWAGHKPRKNDKIDYEKAERRAVGINIIDLSEEYPGPWVYQKRNEFMVDNCDMMLSCWDGETGGGTYNCLKYALSPALDVPVLNINPHTLRVTILDQEDL